MKKISREHKRIKKLERHMKTLKRDLIVILLIVIFVCSFLTAGIIPMAQGIKQMDTPVANLSKDIYSNYANSSLFGESSFANDIKSLGGCVYTKEEYENLYNNKGITADFSSAADVEPQRQIITVMSTATGSTDNGNYVASAPIANAIVRINGVPRYTDRNGQVKVTLDKEYVELIVEKNDYNPYIEIMEVSNTEKVVHLKKESDDIEIFGAMLTDMETLPTNLANGSYNICLDALDTYIANLQIMCNVQADYYCLIAGDEVVRSAADNIIPDIEFTEDMIGKKFYVKVEYQGIWSEPVALKLSVTESIFPDEDDRVIDFSRLNPFDGIASGGFFEDINFDLFELLDNRNILNQDTFGLDLKFQCDFRNGTISFGIGFSIEKSVSSEIPKLKESLEKMKQFKNQEKQINKEIKHYQELINKSDRQIESLYKSQDKNANEIYRLTEERNNNRDRLNTINLDKKAKIRNLNDSIDRANYQIDKAKNDIEKTNKKIEDAISKKNDRQTTKEMLDKQLAELPNIKTNYKKELSQHKHGVTLGLEIVAMATYNYKDKMFSDFKISADFSIGFSWNGTFFIGYVPLYYKINVGGGVGVDLKLYDVERNGWITIEEFWERLLLRAKLEFSGELGIGLNNILNVHLYANLKYELSGYAFLAEFWQNFLETVGSKFEWKIALRLKVFGCTDIDLLSGGGISEKPPLSPDKIYEIAGTNKSSRQAFALTVNENNSALATNIASDSKAKIEKVGDSYVATWIDIQNNNGNLKTIIKYSKFKDNAWSAPKAVDVKGSAFYHDMYFDGKDLHLTWQSVENATNFADLDYMCKNSEIYYAKYDVSTDKFVGIQQLTDNGTLDAAPHFVLQENNSQNLAIAWQKNSLDDIMSLTGKNSIVYSECVGGSWSACQTLYESDNYFSFVDTAYVGGKLTTTFIEDMDNDLLTNDRKIKVIQKSATEKIVGDKFTEVNNPQFNKIDGKVCLSFYGDGNVHYSENFEQVKTFDIEQGRVNDTYKILENENKIYIYYHKNDSENKQQVFASIYDKVSDSWQTDVCLTATEHMVTYPAICVLDNGDILTMYNSTDEETEIVSLQYDIKQMIKDFEITYAFYDMDSQVGDTIKLHIGLKNTGDYPIKNVKVSVFGQTDDIVLEKALQIGETIFVEVERVFAINAQGTETIVCQYEDVQKEYLLATRLTDIAIEGNVTFDTFKEYYNLKLTNSSDYSSKVYMDVYYKGKIVETIELFLDGNSSLDYTYFNDNFENGNFVYFVIRTDVADKYESDNEISFHISNMAEKKNELQNKYYDILQMVKAF